MAKTKNLKGHGGILLIIPVVVILAVAIGIMLIMNNNKTPSHFATFGPNSYIQVNNSATTGYQTVSVWYQTTNITNPKGAILSQGTYGGGSLKWFKQGLNDWQFYFYNTLNGKDSLFRQITPLADGKWHNDVFVYNQSSSKLNWYRDGVLLSANITQFPTYNPTDVPNSVLFIGSLGSNGGKLSTSYPSEGFNGNLAKIQLYGNAFSSSQVSQLYYGTLLFNYYAISNANLLARYPLNSNATDISGNGRNGVISSNVIYT